MNKINIKQAFKVILEDGRVCSCSYRKGNYVTAYFGWITVYKNMDSYKHLPLGEEYTDCRDIRLGDTKEEAVRDLKKFIEDNIAIKTAV